MLGALELDRRWFNLSGPASSDRDRDAFCRLPHRRPAPGLGPVIVLRPPGRTDIVDRWVTLIPLVPGPPRSRPPKPDWLKVRAPGSPNYLRLKGLMRRAQPAHRLRRSAVPEHRRVLESRHRDVHDPRRRLHARCAYCAVAHGRPRPLDPAEAARASPTPSTTLGLTLRRHHVGRSRRPAGRRRVDLRRHDPRDARPAAGVPDRGADSRFPGQRVGAAHRARRAARRAEPQHGNRRRASTAWRVRADGTRGRSSCSIARAATRPTSRRRPGVAWSASAKNNDELVATFTAICAGSGCQILTIGTVHLRPSSEHAPMTRYYHPDEFRDLKRIRARLSGSSTSSQDRSVRSSYHAQRNRRRRWRRPPPL